MSKQYDEYLKSHLDNVTKGCKWLIHNLPGIFLNESHMSEVLYQCEFKHDRSKYNANEYDAYDKYFYGGNRSTQVVEDFNRAWLVHIHNNPHHWQHWVLLNDNPEEGELILDMPVDYIIEMICDWWSFSWSKGNLLEIFSWYNERKNYIKLSPQTRKQVEHILEMLEDKLKNDPDCFVINN